MSADNRSKRTIRLFCPSLSRMVPFSALEEQRLDLGSIARIFGLDPATLRLNGHFISRGVDLIASSVTWRSLLSFFSARGLSTGTTNCDALIVDGKLVKAGNKRFHHEADWEYHTWSSLSSKRRHMLGDCSGLKRSRTKEPLSVPGGREKNNVTVMISSKQWDCRPTDENIKRTRDGEITPDALYKKKRLQ